MSKSQLTLGVKVKVGDKEIEITEDKLDILREYVRTQMTLEQLADKFGLENWEEAYELIKSVPAWILWTPPVLSTIRRRESSK